MYHVQLCVAITICFFSMAGMTRGAFNVRPSMALSPSEVSRRSACASGFSLIPNATYYSTLIVFNGAVNQRSVIVVSDGGECVWGSMMCV